MLIKFQILGFWFLTSFEMAWSQVLLDKLLSGSEQETISTENLPKGIYLITLIDNDG